MHAEWPALGWAACHTGEILPLVDHQWHLAPIQYTTSSLTGLLPHLLITAKSHTIAAGKGGVIYSFFVVAMFENGYIAVD